MTSRDDPKEAEFYLSRAIESLKTLVSRREKRLVLGIILVFTGGLISYTAPSDAPVTLALLGLKCQPNIASSFLVLFGVVALLLGVLDRITILVYVAEIQELHRFRFGTEAPVWCVSPAGSMRMAYDLSSISAGGKILFALVVASLMIPSIAIGVHIYQDWDAIPLIAKIVYAASIVLLVGGNSLLTMIESSWSDIHDKKRLGHSKHLV